ncbi:uroporphyrinogen-III C-methyltransferase [Breznakiellaceae bacterium SP9]
MARIISVGSRESALATAQTRLVIDKMKTIAPEYDYKLVTMKTTGDLILDKPLDAIGGKGLFVKELDKALLSGRIDLAVHSLKDLPAHLEKGIQIAAYYTREDPRDVLVLPQGAPPWNGTLPAGKPIGCSGQRRKLQLSSLFPGGSVENVRGNVLTRLEKLDRGDYSALVLAAAGLKRLGLEHRISRSFEPCEMLPAAGQGILVLTTREDGALYADISSLTSKLASELGDWQTHNAAEAERAFVRALNGSCTLPIAAYATINSGPADAEDTLTLTGLYCPGDYALAVSGSITGPRRERENLGKALATALVAQSQELAAKRSAASPKETAAHRGKVWLVGAGPGDPGLLTLKGDRVLQDAEFVFYDHLVGVGILSRIPSEAQAIYVGKRAGKHAVPQEEIGVLLVQKALEGKRVVRLKGGDPFLFGRGGEELEVLAAAGIPFEVVPGVSSALAVPAYFGIPVTHRDCCSQVHLITGHSGHDIHRDIDYEALVKAGGTLIFLMGLTSLKSICSMLIIAGLDPQTPGAVLEQGTTARQRKVIAPIAQLPSAAKQAGIEPPAIIMTGSVCAFSEKFSWAKKRPLAGLRLGITRPRSRIGRLSELLKCEGAEVVELPSIRTLAIEGVPSLEALFDASKIAALRAGDWLVFTSPTGVEVFFDKLRSLKRDIRTLSDIKFAAIGSTTARALETRGILVDLVPEQFSGDALGKALREAVGPNKRVILPRSRIGTDEVTRHLREEGIEYLDIPIYDTLPAAQAYTDETSNTAYRDILCEDLDYLIFTSASTVEGFVTVYGTERVLRSGLRALCIGAQTAKAAAKYGMETVVAENATLESMIDTLKQQRG